ncbi:hypothetical protein SANTM175S_07565 [Streptomyces antimycoticus]
MSGVPSSVTPMKPIFTPFFFHTLYGLRMGLLRSSSRDVPARYGKSAPAKVCPSVVTALRWWHRRICMRLSSSAALVELMVADRGDVQVQLVQRLDGRFVVEETGHEG